MRSLLKLLLAAAVIVALALLFRASGQRNQGARPTPGIQSAAPAPNAAAFTNAPASGPAKPVRRPLAVARESAAYQWTAEDAKDTNVIRRLAHNELEFARLTDENSRIYRRQLIYHKDTTAAQVERSKLSGQPVQQLTLPGLDGQEVQFEITSSDLNPSGRQGSFSGHVAGRLDSMVTLAFKDAREAFTILSPADHIYLVGEPREPGELIVKGINPETYVVGVCGNP